MDNLLLKVLEFLFIPESVLSWIFLAIFVLCFFYGFKKLKDCKEKLYDFRDNGAAQYQNEKHRLNQKQFMTRFASGQAALEVKVIDLPNMFVSIGILGTFIGLGVAIHGAADLLNADKVDLNQLNAVLNVIAFKFQTSVWGTIFSLIFQKFLAEPYFVKKQNILGEVEVAIYEDAVNLSTAMEWQLAELQGMHAAQGVINDGLGKYVSAMTDTSARQLNEIKNVAQTMAEQNKVMLDNVTSSNAANVKELLQKVGSLVDDSNMSNSQMTKDLLTKVNELVSDTNSSNAKLTKELLTKVDALVSDTDASNSQMIKDLLAKVNDLVDDSKSVNSQTTKELLGKVNELVSATNSDNVKMTQDLLAKVNDLVDDSKSVNSQTTKELLGKVNELVGDSNKNNIKLTQDVLSKVNRLIGDSSETNTSTIHNLLNEVKGLVDNSTDNNLKVANSLLEKVDLMLGDVNESNTSTIHDLLGEVKTLVDNSTDNNIKVANELLEKVDSLLGDVNQQTGVTIKDLINNVNDLVAESNKTNTNSAKNVIANVSEQLTAQKEQIAKLLNEQVNVNKKLATQQEVMLENADQAQKEQAQSIMNNMAEQLKLQKEHINTMLNQQSSLNRALLGDMQDASATNATSMREGVFQQMEQYKKYADELAKKQLKAQEELEKKLVGLSGSIDTNSNANSKHIAELQKAIAVLQKAINDNSAVLEGIVNTFYKKQDELDEFRRAQINGMAQNFAQTFDTLFKQESSNTAEWRKSAEPAKEKKTTTAKKKSGK